MGQEREAPLKEIKAELQASEAAIASLVRRADACIQSWQRPTATGGNSEALNATSQQILNAFPHLNEAELDTVAATVLKYHMRVGFCHDPEYWTITLLSSTDPVAKYELKKVMTELLYFPLPQ